MYDTHCHLNFQAFENDYHDVIQRSLKKGMFLNIVGSQYETSKKAVAIAEEFIHYPVFAAIGLHPTHSNKNDTNHIWDDQKYLALAKNPKVVAIGECGIDLFRQGKEILEDQKNLFHKHLDLARSVKKPLIIHCRPSPHTSNAYDILYSLLKEQKKCSGIIHCFLADHKHAQKFLDLGFFISFTGIITFKNADRELLRTVEQVPLEKIMIETDAPYLTPEPFRGKKQNEPLFVYYVAEAIARIKKIPIESVLTATTATARQFFGV